MPSIRNIRCVLNTTPIDRCPNAKFSTNLGNHEDEDGHGGRLVGLRDAVVLPVVVVVDGSELRRGQFWKRTEENMVRVLTRFCDYRILLLITFSQIIDSTVTVTVLIGFCDL